MFSEKSFYKLKKKQHFCKKYSTLNPLKRLAGQTAIYGLSSIVGRLLNYLLVPMYTRVFLTNEFGVITEMYSYVAFLIVILTYGMETAYFRFNENHKGTDTPIFSTVLFSILSTTTLFLIVGLIFKQPIAELLRYPDNPEYIVWFSIIIAMDAISAIPFARLRAENKAVRFASLKFINIGVNIGLNLFFILLCPWVIKTQSGSLAQFFEAIYDPRIGVGYVFISNLVASGLTLVLLAPQMFRIKPTFSFPLWKQMLLYALPLLVAGLAGIINETMDKLLLKFILPEDIAMSQVGIYGACYKISIMMTIFIQAFRFAAEPFFFAEARKENAAKLYSDVMNYFIIACSLIFVGIMLYIDVVKLFVGEEFREGLPVVPILLLANLFLGVFFNLSIWYKLSGQTRFGAYLAVIGALITIVLNVWWIPLIGYMGSAWATLICYFSMMVLSWYWGQKHYPIPYQHKKGIAFIIGAVGIYLISEIMPDMVSGYRLLVNSSLLVVYLLFIAWIEREVVKKIVRRFL